MTNLQINDEIGLTILAATADDNDYTLFCKIVEVGTRDGERAYRYEYPNGELSSALLPASLVTKFRLAEAGDDEVLQTAFRQVYFGEVALTSDAKAGERAHTALMKAIAEIESNPTIRFNQGVLTFVSRFSGKRRTVNALGCHADTCDCGNQYSYHKAIYDILARRDELTGSNVAAFKPRETATDWSVGERFGWAA